MSSTPNRQHDSSWFNDDSSFLQGESDEHDEESDPNDNDWFNDGSSSLQEEIDQHDLTSAPPVITGRIEEYIGDFRNATNNRQRVDALKGLSWAGLVGAAFQPYYAYGAQTFVHQLSKSRQAFTSFLSRSRLTVPHDPVPLPADMRTGDPTDDALLASWWDRKQATDQEPSRNIQAEGRAALEKEVNEHFWNVWNDPNDANDTRVGEALTNILSQAWVEDVDVKGVRVGIEKRPLSS
ncbi:hypothetical protein B9479_005693 [Cryptococcus floricola]|uniref:Uncharacterized protein n=1 Tax=Cryptococcus floricola TaxID=2591691 RepID=A0A5D3AQ33_9TREE|nr:hypothetical protein B9479_005693 [Cryptococcus floricola]